VAPVSARDGQVERDSVIRLQLATSSACCLLPASFIPSLTSRFQKNNESSCILINEVNLSKEI
jgi:hypothetical protein